jgi:ComF family protein
MVRAFQFLLDLLYPPRCAGCDRVDTRWCASCQQELADVPFDLRQSKIAPLKAIATTGIHEGKLQQAVHALKYAGAHEVAAPLGERLVMAITTLNWQFDMIMPLPLHSARQRERGANQAEQLASFVALELNLPYSHTALTRWRDTPPQVGLNRAQRLDNVRDAFRANAPISGTVLLIDDVFTTGATLQACAQAAREAGASAVYGLTVSAARSPMDKGV